MEKKKKIDLLILLNGLLTAVSVYLLFTTLAKTQTNIWQNVEIIADIVACIVALLYLIDGYSKGLANRYKLFMFLTSINALAVTVLSIGEKTQTLSIIMCAMAFAFLLVLSLSVNLGKTKSYICCALLLIIRVAGLFSNILIMGNELPRLNLALFISQLSLALLVCVATYAKYTDKDSRQTI